MKFAVTVVVLLWSGLAAAQVVPDDEQPPQLDPFITTKHVEGPKLVDLGNQIEFDLPKDMILLEAPEAKKLLEESGDDPTGVLGVVGRRDSQWMIVIEYNAIGYVSDAEADELDAGEL